MAASTKGCVVRKNHHPTKMYRYVAMFVSFIQILWIMTEKIIPISWHTLQNWDQAGMEKSQVEIEHPN